MQEYEGWLFSSKDFSTTDTSRWQDLVNEASSKFGKELDMARKLKPLMEQCGFVDVQEQIVKVSPPFSTLYSLRSRFATLLTQDRSPSAPGPKASATRSSASSSASTSATASILTPWASSRACSAGRSRSARS